MALDNPPITDPVAVGSLVNDDTEWELRVAQPENTKGVVTIPWEWRRVRGDLRVNNFVVRASVNGGSPQDGNQIVALSSHPPADATLTVVASAGDQITITVTGYDNTGFEGEGTKLVEVTNVTVPEADTDFELVQSPVSVPTWASPIGQSVTVDLPGTTGQWTEAYVSSLSVSGSEGTVSYEATITAEAISGDPQTITRTFVADVFEPGFYPPVEREVTLDAGSSTTLTGSFDARPADSRPVVADVRGREYGPPEIEYNYDSASALWSMPPTATPDIPAPAPDPEGLLNNPRVYSTLFESPADGFSYYGNTANIIPKRKFQMAVVGWLGGEISDARMARLHALYLFNDVPLGADMRGDEPPSQGSPVLVTAGDDGAIHIYNNRDDDGAGVPFLYGYGPGLRYDDRSPSLPRGTTPGPNYHRITGLVPGGSYTFTYSESEFRSTSDELQRVFAPARATADASPPPEPDPQPDPDPDPTPPSDDPEPDPQPAQVEAECLLDDVEVPLFDTVEIPVRVSEVGGGQSAAVGVTVTMAGQSKTTSASVSAGGSTTVSLTFEAAETGEYQPSVSVEIQ